MKQLLTIPALILLVSFAATSCKKNWECTRSYRGNPSDPNSSVITQYEDITAKSRREAKLECKAFAAEAGKDTNWELKAK